MLRERGLSLRALARMADIGNDHMSRILRGARNKRPTGELTRRVAAALDLPEDYFPEARLTFVVQQLGNHPKLLDRVYDELQRAHAADR